MNGSWCNANVGQHYVRKHPIELLHDFPMSVAQIARVVGEQLREVADDVEHLLPSLKHTEYSAAIVPARCRKCGFELAEHKLRRPSRCLRVIALGLRSLALALKGTAKQKRSYLWFGQRFVAIEFDLASRRLAISLRRA